MFGGGYRSGAMRIMKKLMAKYGCESDQEKRKRS